MLAMRYLNCNMVADETKVTTRFGSNVDCGNVPGAVMMKNNISMIKVKAVHYSACGKSTYGP